MKRILIAAGTFAAGATMLFAAVPAMARVDVDVNIGVPGAYVPAPVYVQPRPYYAPPPRVVYAPQPVYVAPRYSNDWRRHQWREHHRHDRHMRGRGDRDHDGVPNRYDHRPYDPRRY